MPHINAVEHSLTWRAKNKDRYKEYMRVFMKKRADWKKISMEFMRILL